MSVWVPFWNPGRLPREPRCPLETIFHALSEPLSDYLASLPSRRVWPDATPDQVRVVVDRPLPDRSTDAVEVVTRLAAELEPFVTAHASGRYFGFVIGGLHPAAYGAELLAASWDQNAGLFALAPGVAIAEEVAARWIVELLSLPEDSAVGFVTGGQMASFTCLAAARDQLLRAIGWDVEADGLPGAPPLHVVVKTGVHATVPRALRYLGLGERTMIEVASDDQDRIASRKTSTPARSTTSKASPTPSMRIANVATPPGCTSTARWACWLPPCRATTVRRQVSRGWIRGPWTHTS